jgi:hypothetical protein
MKMSSIVIPEQGILKSDTDDSHEFLKERGIQSPSSVSLKGILMLSLLILGDIPLSFHVSALDSDYGNLVKIDGNVHVINSFLDKVGMGRYQWQLWVLCGFGWVADQMLLQMIAIIQPRIQAEFNIDGYKVGGITSSYFAGLATGAAFWGYGADIWGRKMAFNLTLLTAGIFGIAMGGQMGYAGLCGIAAALGTGTGGNLPLDGAIYLETSPRVNQRALMLMSIFWCLGQRMFLHRF